MCFYTDLTEKGLKMVQDTSIAPDWQTNILTQSQYFSQVTGAFLNLFFTANLQTFAYSGKNTCSSNKNKHMQLWHGEPQAQLLETKVL